MSEKLSHFAIEEIFMAGYVIFGEKAVDGAKIVAILLDSEAGVTIYRHRKEISVEDIYKACEDPTLRTKYQLYDVS